jgi:hypothetical protein
VITAEAEDNESKKLLAYMNENGLHKEKERLISIQLKYDLYPDLEGKTMTLIFTAKSGDKLIPEKKSVTIIFKATHRIRK